MEASNKTRESVAMSCAYMNDVDLPNAYAMARAMSDLVAMARAIDRNSFNDSGIVEALRPHLGANL